MTKRKAIEEAVDAGWDAYTYQAGTSEDCETMADGMDRLANVSADRAYELGRIAGLREAGRLTVPPENDASEWAWNEIARIRKHANALARKVRSK